MSAPHTKPNDPHAHDAGHHGVGHVVSPKILFATAAALLVLTVITVKAAEIDFSVFEMAELNVFVALGIALIKASLVCLFFMHLRWDRPFNAFVLIGSLAFVAVFISFAMTDSFQYQHEIIKGDAKDVAAEVAKLPAPASP
jgi:cytochrome c oxidase subunit 4